MCYVTYRTKNITFNVYELTLPYKIRSSSVLRSIKRQALTPKPTRMQMKTLPLLQVLPVC